MMSQDFSRTYRYLCEVMKKRASCVRTERWQGVDVSRDPSATSYELVNIDFEVDLRGIEDLDHWRAEIGPNLPWADDHFEERVGGKCLNPGEEWKNWPWAKSADKFRSKPELGPRMAPQDWAYLAAMIEGEGTIDPRSNKLPTFQGRISVGQKTPEMLEYLKNTFKVGSISQMPGRSIKLHGKDYDNACFIWTVYGSANIRWIVANCLPYFKVTRKREKAEEMIRVLNEGDKKQDHPRSHRSSVWDQEWPGRFQANYMDRFWPRRMEGGSDFYGIQGRYGDLNDWVKLLAQEPHTRQAWFPIFHPDETGAIEGGRVMCSLGYQLMVRDDQIIFWYPLRSCDLRRHFRDDCYLAVRMMLWVLDRCREINPMFWNKVRPGTYAMHMTSLHIFENDRRMLMDGVPWDSQTS